MISLDHWRDFPGDNAAGGPRQGKAISRHSIMRILVKFRSVVIILAFAVFQGFGADQDKSEERLVLFETVWSKVNETYFDPSFGGLDWQKVHDGYRPQIAAAKSEPDVHALLNKMLWELKVSHAAYIPRGYFATVEPTVFAPGGIGLDTRLLGGQAVVTAVGPESPA